MAHAEVTVRKRDATGKGPAKRMRKAGWVPAVIYGHGSVGEKLAVERRRLEKLLDAGAHMVGLRQEAEGGAASTSASAEPQDPGPRRALIREVQVHPVTQEILHVDFQEVAAHDLVRLSVRVTPRGEPAGVKEGGVLDIVTHEVEIEHRAESVMAGEVGEEFRIDVSGLEIGDSFCVNELVLPEGARAVTPGDRTIFAVRRPREVVEEEAPAADTEVPAQPEVITEKKREEEPEEGH